MTSISGVCRHHNSQNEPIPKHASAPPVSHSCSLGQSDTVSNSTEKMGSAPPDAADGGQATAAEMTAVLGDLEALVTALVDSSSDAKGDASGDAMNVSGRKPKSTQRKTPRSASMLGHSNATIRNANSAPGNLNAMSSNANPAAAKGNATGGNGNATGGNGNGNSTGGSINMAAGNANAAADTSNPMNSNPNTGGSTLNATTNAANVAGSGANATNGAGDTATGGKKGEAVPTGADGTGKEIGNQNASWWYNWTPNTNGVQASNNAQFVPMIWGQKDMDPATLASVKSSSSPDLLTFNEPDISGQSNMSVDQAIADWPALESTGKQLSAPAVGNANINDPNSWLNQFMTKAQEQNLPVAFIPLHWYGSSHDPTQNVNALHDYIQSVEDKYHKPIWLTEFGLIDFSNKSQPTPQENAQFLTQASQMLDSLPYVKRYSFFDLSQSNPPSSDSTPGNTYLYDANQNITPVGKADQDAE